MANHEPDPLAIIAKLADEERRLSEGVFLAPVVGGGRVSIRLQGVVYEMRVNDQREGWAMLKMTGPATAQIMGEAPRRLVERYLSLFPRIRLVMLDVFGDKWWALPASRDDRRIKENDPVMVLFPGKVSRFDTVYCRHDGRNLWFETIDRRRDTKIARSLRECLEGGTKPSELHCLGMVPQEKLAYKMLWLRENQEPETEFPDDRTRVTAALRHAGASMDAFWYQGGDDRAAVRFLVDGETHTVIIRPADLSVLSAGICLSGRDADFDLNSLVGVFREYAGQ